MRAIHTSQAESTKVMLALAFDLISVCDPMYSGGGSYIANVCRLPAKDSVLKIYTMNLQ